MHLQRSELERQALHMKHLLSQKWVQDDMARKRVNTRMQTDTDIIVVGEGMVRELGKRLICPKCERLAYRHWERDHKGNPKAKCPSCGWYGEALTYDEYFHEKLSR